MTDPAGPRPVSGPPRSGAPRPGPDSFPADVGAAAEPAEGSPFAGLSARPVTEHVAVYQAEHERLQRELSTIDQL